MTDKSKVLIIEDDPWFSEIIETILKKNDFETKKSLHIIEAIDDIDEFMPDLIITDLLLAGSTAFNLLNELQSHSDLAKIPIIVCSNISANLRLSDLGPYGVEALLDKSTMHPQDIIDQVKRLLYEKK